jgi:ABC-type transporter MlaC component
MKIVDAVVSGVSMAMTQRSDFTAVLRRDGVDGFIDRLEAQLSALKKRSR